MTLRQKQVIFLQNFACLIQFAAAQGYEVTAGELFRTNEQQAIYLQSKKSKVAISQHQKRLAGDLNLFKNGKYLTTSEDHKPLGDYWKSLHEDNRWGGDFKSLPDGNHYEMKS